MRDIFLTPLLSLLPACASQRKCPVITDAHWLTLGIHRALEPNVSGRGFLQQLATTGTEAAPDHRHFFEALDSPRRLALCDEINLALLRQARRDLPDNLAAFPALADYDIYAGDGHFHTHAVHDPADPITGQKTPIGHLYACDLRTGCMRHLAIGDQSARKKEHDMHALKRLIPSQLRMDAPKGRKVLYVWDRAGIDFLQWHKWKTQHGIYFLSRSKTNFNLTQCGHNPYDAADPINSGVVADRIVGGASCGVQMREIEYLDTVSGETYRFLTNLNDTKIAPGLIAHLYQLRWRIEKRFDEIKNKMLERKAWASSATAKSMQAQFICLTINLLNYLDERLRANGIENTAEKARARQRLEQTKARLAKTGHRVPPIYELTQILTQHSVKLIRWLHKLWDSHTRWAEATPIIANMYAKL